MSEDVEVELESPVGPRVLVWGDRDGEEVEAEVPAGWLVDWATTPSPLSSTRNGERGYAHPLVRAEVEVEASSPRRTNTGVARAVDVDVEVTLPDGRVVDGEVTLLPAEDGRPRYERWGDADHWVDSALLRELRSALRDHYDFRQALERIEDAASAEAGRPSLVDDEP